MTQHHYPRPALAPIVRSISMARTYSLPVVPDILTCILGEYPSIHYLLSGHALPVAFPTRNSLHPRMLHFRRVLLILMVHSLYIMFVCYAKVDAGDGAGGAQDNASLRIWLSHIGCTSRLVCGAHVIGTFGIQARKLGNRNWVRDVYE
jgi:hypothetical protein